MEDILDISEQPIDIVKYRQSLLPFWIKAFSWFFLIVGGFFSIATLLSLLVDNSLEFSAFGFNATTLNSVDGLVVFVMTVLSVIVSYGLLYGKSWAVKLGIIFCMINILLFFAVFIFRISIRFEYLPIFPFFFKLMNLNLIWNAPKNNAQ